MTITNILQQKALDVFSTMERMALEYRTTGTDPERFDHNHGICNNIEGICDSLGMDYSTYTKMSRVKDNLIRCVPSYSGLYHYPVKGPNGENAERAWDNISDRWAGEYGANRMIQLGELIDAIKTRWNDNLTGEMTPAQQFGFKVGETVIHKEENKLYVFFNDDGSRDPYFMPVGVEGNGNRVAIRLEYLQKLDVAMPSKAMSVPAFLKTIEKKQAKLTALKAQITALELQAAKDGAEIAMLDAALAKQHKVKRI